VTDRRSRLVADGYDHMAGAWEAFPRERLAELLEHVQGWLRPGGLLLAAFGTSDLEGWEGEWLGVPMFFSSFPPAENSRIVAMAGFELLRDEVVEIGEPDGDVPFQWVLAEKRA